MLRRPAKSIVLILVFTASQFLAAEPTSPAPENRAGTEQCRQEIKDRCPSSTHPGKLNAECVEGLDEAAVGNSCQKFLKKLQSRVSVKRTQKSLARGLEGDDADPQPLNGTDADQLGMLLKFMDRPLLPAAFLLGTLLGIAIFWQLSVKMGIPGWISLVPFYNVFRMLQAMNKPTWWVLGLLVPLLGYVVWAALCLSIAQSFGKSKSFGLLCALFPPMIALIAFGNEPFQAGDTGGSDTEMP